MLILQFHDTYTYIYLHMFVTYVCMFILAYVHTSKMLRVLAICRNLPQAHTQGQVLQVIVVMNYVTILLSKNYSNIHTYMHNR